MHFCMHCGARWDDSAATSCPSCGMPRLGGVPDDTGQPGWATGDGYVRVGSTALPQWVLWVTALLLVVGGLTAYGLVASSPDSPPGPSREAVDSIPSATVTPPGAGAEPEPSTDDYTPAVPDGHSPEEEDERPAAPEPLPPPENASTVVEEFYRAINDRDFTAAWELGGKNIAGTSYEEWVAGYDTTAIAELNAVDTEGAGQVSAVLYATQNDGSVKVYHGTYTVEDGVIVSADIAQG